MLPPPQPQSTATTNPGIKAQTGDWKSYDPGVYQNGDLFSTSPTGENATTRADWIKAHPGDQDVFDVGGAGARARASAPQQAPAPAPIPEPAPAPAATTGAPTAAAPTALPSPMLTSPPPPGPGWASTGPGSLNPNLGKQIPRQSMQALSAGGQKGVY